MLSSTTSKRNGGSWAEEPIGEVFQRPPAAAAAPRADWSGLAKSPSESLKNDGNLAALFSRLKSLEAVLLNVALIYARCIYLELLILRLIFSERFTLSLATLLIFRG
jgi:hypothetical protein